MSFFGSLAKAAIGPLISGGLGILGGKLSDDASASEAAKNRALQREFAQHGVRWKAEDAKRAGLHPLFAMGAPTMSPAVSMPDVGGVGRGLAQMGQDVSRSIAATRSREDRLRARMLEAQIEGQELENMGQRLRNRAEAKSQLGAGIPLSQMPVVAEPLGPVKYDSEGNRIFPLPGRGTLKWPMKYSQAQEIEDTFGDVMAEIIMGSAAFGHATGFSD